MKIFIAGSGIPHGDNEKFAAAATQLKELGHDPVTGYHVHLDPAWEEDGWYVVVDYILRGCDRFQKCDAVAMLDDWKSSHGASYEVGFATALGVPCRLLGHWLSRPVA